MRCKYILRKYVKQAQQQKEEEQKKKKKTTTSAIKKSLSQSQPHGGSRRRLFDDSPISTVTSMTSATDSNTILRYPSARALHSASTAAINYTSPQKIQSVTKRLFQSPTPKRQTLKRNCSQTSLLAPENINNELQSTTTTTTTVKRQRLFGPSC